MITIPTGDLTGVLSDVVPFAWPKDDLQVLNTVRVEWDGQQLHAMSTDRIRVGWSTWEPGDVGKFEEVQDDLFAEWGSADDPWACTLSLADATQIAKVFTLGPKEEGQVPLTVDYERARRRLTVKRTKETGHSAITISAEDTFVEFPNVALMLSGADKLTARREVEYNARMLADFAKVRPRGPLSMRHTKGLTHVSIGERFVGAIVPVARPTDG